MVERPLAPQEIEDRSMAIVEGLLPDLPCSWEERQIVKRIVHTTGDPGLAQHIRIHPGAVEAARKAIRAGALIYADVKMLASGIDRSRTGRFGCEIRCLIDDPQVAREARETGTTRATAAIRHMGQQLNGAVVAIGNAPTALEALLELVDAGEISPALIVGTPVGFVGAAESKMKLAERSVPFVTVEGTRGGSATAVACVNALLRLAESTPETEGKE